MVQTPVLMVQPCETIKKRHLMVQRLPGSLLSLSIVYDLNWWTHPFNNPTNLLSTRATQTVYGSVTRFALTTRARQTLLHPSKDSRNHLTVAWSRHTDLKGKTPRPKVLLCANTRKYIYYSQKPYNERQKPHNNFPKRYFWSSTSAWFK